MFMEICKAGLLDSFQDHGRQGLAHLGMGTGGCMDSLAASLANILVGNAMEEPVLEMHFPAAKIRFEKAVILALSGADFAATVAGISIPINRQIHLPANSELIFEKKESWQRCCLGVAGGWDLPIVLNSGSTLLKTGIGGWEGRALKKKDLVPLKSKEPLFFSEVNIAPYFVAPYTWYRAAPFHVFPGPEWNELSPVSQKQLMETAFTITPANDRMGYRLAGSELERLHQKEMRSSAVLPGTIQLLPNGQPLVLMADGQTTGGYPRILQIAEVDLPRLAQLGTGDSLWFSFLEMDTAIQLKQSQQNWLHQVAVGMQFQAKPAGSSI